MTRQWARQPTYHWMFAASALGASALLVLSPWFALTPFDALLSRWGVHILSFLSNGIVMTRVGGRVQGALQIALVPCFAMPFWGLRHVVHCEQRWPRMAIYLLLLVFVALATLSAINSACFFSQTTGWDSWQIAEIGINACLGMLLVALGCSLKQVANLQEKRLRRIRYGLWVAGTSIASYLLLPIGLIVLFLVYLNLGSLFLHEENSR